MPATHSRQGLGWLVLAGITWGTSGTLGTFLRTASGLEFLAIAGYRIFVGGLLVLGYVVASRRFRPPRTWAGWRRVLAIATASGIYQFAFFTAIGDIGVAIATLITIGSSPVMVLIVEALTGRQRLTPHLALTLAVAAGGLGLLVGAPPAGASPDALVRGVLLALTAGASFAAISIVGARPEPDFHTATGTGLSFLIGGAAVLAFAASRTPVTFTPTPGSVGLVIALGLIPSAVAYLSYLHGLKTQTGTTGALVTLLEPVTATILATLVLGERLTPLALAGAGLLLLAVGLTSLGRRAAVGSGPV